MEGGTARVRDDDGGDRLRAGLSACAPEAFAEVYRTYVGDVLRHLQSGVVFGSARSKGVIRVTDPFEAEDVAQEAFEEFFRQCGVGRFDVERSVKNYVISIAGYIALGRQRKDRLIPMEADTFVLIEAEPSFLPEEVQLVRAFRETLDDVDERVFELYFFEELAQREVGTQLGMSRDQVFRRLETIKRKALEFFRERGWFDES